jgi:hypothetical protein|nr:MAG TPA: IS66 C-terminal element [Caudoviricetes sp.]
MENNCFWAKITLVVALIVMFIGLCVTKCNAQSYSQKPKAQYDTVYCNAKYIVKYTSTTTSTGKLRYFAVYKDTANKINELIPVSQTVYDYIQTCKANGIEPSLGIKLKNGQISSLIRFKPVLRITRK